MRICEITDCIRVHKAKGLCDTHIKERIRRQSPEYGVWVDLKRRCYNRKFKQYDDWGGRGIRVCSRWLHSYQNFLNDMGVRPSSGYSIERIDTDGDYSPENCRWATKFEQNNNRRDTVKITIGDINDTFSGWATRSGLSRTLLVSRYYKGIRSSELLAPSRYKKGRYVHGG